MVMDGLSSLDREKTEEAYSMGRAGSQNDGDVGNMPVTEHRTTALILPARLHCTCDACDERPRTITGQDSENRLPQGREITAWPKIIRCIVRFDMSNTRFDHTVTDRTDEMVWMPICTLPGRLSSPCLVYRLAGLRSSICIVLSPHCHSLSPLHFPFHLPPLHHSTK